MLCVQTEHYLLSARTTTNSMLKTLETHLALGNQIMATNDDEVLLSIEFGPGSTRTGKVT